ncbi:MAG TPA: 1-deoxy-D-xylulose-5-phosphate reductoisomerase [Intrasporangium sp.]|uniref:1-deoxy-D-xylulose-5-phosphate reductoisomerase n=1 Tax=Intrasporangium sp. TaxID=1925024 RepID=UPI002D776E4E|nr:1-deoxy-D-xylulose-5-phosphate reductoisomerase [Intrasporangium sp.]HET7399305.1 1-deoxy-D-xylulose-5-phosphate reductoisomerase [Intrasporangium sp.]
MTDAARSTRPRRVVLLGSTGSIGTQALDLVRRNPDRFAVTGLSAGANLELVARQAALLRVPVVAVAVDDEQALATAIARAADEAGTAAYDPELLTGPDASTALAAREADVVLNGITGAIGLAPTLAALEAGTTLALANKESLIIGGPLVRRAAAPGQLVPVDSEHSAIAQCLRGGRAEEVRRLVITASGGPFRGRTRADLQEVTVEQALAHPNFAMGPVITTNSATLVNKGLEVIEAHLLFDVPFERIDVVVHPQQVIHSMVEFTDGSTIAQASPPSMLIPIALGMAWPHRVPGAGPAIDWSQAASWDFEPLDQTAFPAVALAKQVGAAGGTWPAVYNAANEVCVQGFFDGRLRFVDIVDEVARVVEAYAAEPGSRVADVSLADVLEADRWARAAAVEVPTTP